MRQDYEHMTGSQNTTAVAILGSGPAGSATALLLSRSGIDACIIEPSLKEVWKAGEALPPAARHSLITMGLWDRFLRDEHQPWYGNTSAWGSSRTAEHDFIFNANGCGWHLDRARFDKMLVTAAIEAGTRLFRAARLVRSWSVGDSGWELELLSGQTLWRLKASFVVDASGRASCFARRAGARRVSYDNLVGITTLLHRPTERSEWDRSTLVESTRNGWWYSAPLPDSSLTVTYFTDADHPCARLATTVQGWMSLVRDSLHHRRRVEAGPYAVTAPPRVFSANSSCLSHRAGGGWLGVGDAAHSYDPLSSQGILTALTSSALACTTIHLHLEGDRDAWRGYSSTMESAYRRYLDERNAYYQIETRWPTSQFWERRTNLKTSLERKD